MPTSLGVRCHFWDGLTTNHILIDYGQNRLVFPKFENSVLVTAHQVMTELRDGSK